MLKQHHKRAIHWFRKGLRLHDNPALVQAARDGEQVFPVFILDPHFANEDVVSGKRYQFLLESLRDLDVSLKKLDSKLFIARGNPQEVLPQLCTLFDATLVTAERDTEPYALARDQTMAKRLAETKVTFDLHWSHTLHSLDRLAGFCQMRPPTVYRSFLKNVFQKAGAVPLPVAVPGNLALTASSLQWAQAGQFDLRLGVPTLTDMGYSAELKQQSAFLGGESEALLRLKTQMKRTQWVQKFEKPKTSPNSLTPSTTVLSPYLKFGCLSVRTFYHELLRVPKPKTQPPVSLEGQLLWREFYYASAYLCPNYDQMQDNPICRNIPWREVIVPPTTTSAVREKVDAQSAHAHLQAWQQGRTGFPYIDAIMTQLNTEGWIHHLARHSVACFLTRGDLFISWEHGARYFDKELLDADWSLNNGNWMWLSASCYFYQYFRCYSPIKFGQKTDKTGAYIRKWVPQLRDMPAKYIYEPWTAPLHVQEASGCVIGQDYPAPIVDHRVVSKRNMQWMKTAYEQYKTKSKSAAKATTGAKRKLSTTTASKQRKPRKKGKVQAKLKF